MTTELDLGNLRCLVSSPIFGMYALPTVSTLGAGFRNVALREECVAETIWTESVTEPQEGLNINFKILDRCKVYGSHPRQASYTSSLTC